MYGVQLVEVLKYALEKRHEPRKSRFSWFGPDEIPIPTQFVAFRLAVMVTGIEGAGGGWYYP